MKKIVVFAIIIIIYSQIAFCVDWGISAVPFKGDAASIDRKNTVVKTTSEIINELLPRLILNELQINGNRLITQDEALTRLLYALNMERQTLFEELSLKITARDNVLFSATSNSDFKSKRKTAEKEIAEVRKKLEKNIEYTNKPTETLSLALKEKSKIDFSFKAGSFSSTVSNKTVKASFLDDERWTVYPGEFLPVTLWKQDNSALFDVKKDDETNTAYQSRVLEENLSCVISGSFFVRDDFIYIKVRADFFPRKIGEPEAYIEISDVGSVQNLPDLARSAAYQIIPTIVNVKPIELIFDINPPEALNNLRVALDGIILPMQNNSVIITPGQKVLTISSDGYANEETIFNFRGHDSYKISVTLHPETQIALNMTALNTEGQFYFNALSNDLQNSLGTLPSST
ncbi:MAG: hypothetical protein ACRC5H_01605, partial [Treponemataceae bacterium]